jgi:Ca2+-binding RTX toxin-like protein
MGVYRLTEGNDLIGIDPFRYPSNDPGPFVVYGLGGDDGVTGGDFNDTLYGGEGNDSLFGARGANTLFGGNGNDYLQIYNEPGNGPNYDLLADDLFGGAGNDSIQFILGGASVAHRANGGSGIDTLSISFESRFETLPDGTSRVLLYNKVIDLRAMWTGGWGTIDTGRVRGFEILGGIEGGQGNDRIIIGNYNAPLNPGTQRPYDLLISGLGGDDYISGGASYDQINGGAGSDRIYGNDGDDYLAAGPSTAGAGNDTIFGGNGNDIILGGGGNDRLYGQAGADNIQALAGDNLILGGAGDDFLTAEFGNDRIYGGGGNDRMSGGDGRNALYGDAGNDSLSGGADVDVLRGGTGDDFLAGLGGADELYGNSGTDLLQGLNGADTSYGGAGNDTLDETVQDDSANDRLYGDAGDDILRGGGGADWLFGGTGADTLTGGAGRDSFWFTTAPDGDTITDFSRAEGDRILLSQDVFTAFANKGKLAADAFRAGVEVDAARDASDRILYNTATGELRYDVDGVGGAAAQLIATLGDGSHPRLSYVDILIVA